MGSAMMDRLGYGLPTHSLGLGGPQSPRTPHGQFSPTPRGDPRALARPPSCRNRTATWAPGSLICCSAHLASPTLLVYRRALGLMGTSSAICIGTTLCISRTPSSAGRPALGTMPCPLRPWGQATRQLWPTATLRLLPAPSAPSCSVRHPPSSTSRPQCPLSSRGQRRRRLLRCHMRHHLRACRHSHNRRPPWCLPAEPSTGAAIRVACWTC